MYLLVHESSQNFSCGVDDDWGQKCDNVKKTLSVDNIK